MTEAAPTIRRTLTISQSATAPEKMRMNVNEAASMLVCFSAARQRSELLAKAIIASKVRIRIRALKGSKKSKPQRSQKAKCASHLERCAKMWNQAFAEFDRVTGGQM